MSRRPTKKPSEDKNPVGRPELLKDGQRVNVYLDAASKEKAARIGGNVSEGIRKALDAFPE